MTRWQKKLGPVSAKQERVARRLCALSGYREDDMVMNGTSQQGPKGTIVIADEQWPAWTLFLPEARAAIDELGGRG